MDKECDVDDPAYNPPLDKEFGIMFVLESKDEVRRFVAANCATARSSGTLNHTCTQDDGN
jgi:hypothetical protein